MNSALSVYNAQSTWSQHGQVINTRTARMSKTCDLKITVKISNKEKYLARSNKNSLVIRPGVIYWNSALLTVH